MRLSSTDSTRPFAFLLTVESGARADSGTDKQTGAWFGVDNDATVEYYSPYTTVIRSSQTIASAYELYWTAPAELTYDDLTIRTTFVPETTDTVTTCDGVYKEYTLDSSVVCADGMKDDMERCDDGNTVDGDGCRCAKIRV